MKLTSDAVIAILLAAAFAAALSVRAWKNTNRILAERRVEAHVRAAGRRFRMDPQAQDRIRASLVAAAARTPLADRLQAADYIAEPEQPIAYALTEKALTDAEIRGAAPRCRHYLYYRPGGHR